MTPSRPDLLLLDRQLTDRDRRIIEIVSLFRLMQAGQIERLLFSDLSTGESAARQCRRTLVKLCELRVLARLERRIGGVRAGSSGHLYTVAPTGRRLIAHWAGSARPNNRGVHEPGLRFIEHTLQIAGLRVRLHDAEAQGLLEVLEFQPEPGCWRPYTAAGGQAASLKPDAYLRIGIGEWEERAFVEIDLATEGRAALARKIRTYSDYYRTGGEQRDDGIFPRVAWLTTSQRRAQAIEQIAEEYEPTTGLHVVALLDDAIDVLAGAAAMGAAS